MLHQLCYISAKAPGFDLSEMPILLKKSRQNNEKSKLTGLLLFANGSFLQVLEGPLAAIQERFARIEDDPRHCWIVQLRSEPIAKRLFHDWTMGWHACDPSDETAGLVRNIASLDHLGKVTGDQKSDLDRVLETFARHRFNAAA